MRILLFFLLCNICTRAQELSDTMPVYAAHFVLNEVPEDAPVFEDEILARQFKWQLKSDKLISGGFVFVAGFTKGFNETLTFHWKRFKKSFPGANEMWFNPNVSWRNKYKNGDPGSGARFPLSTSVLVAFTDQYHLNNFVNKLAWTSALVLNFSGGKRPLKHYLLDMLYYTVCHQAGFALSYYPFKSGRK